MTALVHVAGPIIMLIAGLSLWFRRGSWGCPWEGAPNLMVASAGGAALLTSPLASTILGPPLYRLTGRWHVEDFAGHVLAMVCAAALTYSVLVRLGDDVTLRDYFNKMASLPLTVALPVLIAIFSPSSAVREHDHPRLSSVPIGPWLAIYWFVLIGTITLLLANALRGLATLRRHDGPSLVMRAYSGTAMLSIAFWVTLGLDLAFVADLHDLVWATGYASALGWCLTPALSWRIKTRLKLPLCNLAPGTPGVCGLCPLQARCPYESSRRPQ